MTDKNIFLRLPPYKEADTKDFVDLVRSPLAIYNEEIIKNFGYLDTQGLALDDEDNENGLVYIDQLYVLPDASSERISPEHIAQQEIDGKKEVNNRRQISSLIRSTPRLVLLGDPGVGKTTFVQWLVSSLSHISNNFAKEQLGNLFPLIATARKMSPNSVDKVSVQSFIDNVILSQGNNLSNLLKQNEPKEFLYSLLKTGQIVLIVDGLDEVSDDLKSWLSSSIRLLIEEFPKLRLILTSRVVGYNNVEFWLQGWDKKVEQKDVETTLDNISNRDIEKLFHIEESSDIEEKIKEEEIDSLSKDNRIATMNDLSHVYYLAPFSPKQRESFANNWLENYIPPNIEKRQEFMGGINAVSKHSLQLNALSRIPVLLNLICFILYRRGKLPNGRAELYQRIVETYLVTMDKVRRIKKELSEEYDYHDIKSWLAKLALQMQTGTSLNIDTGRIGSFSDEKLESYRINIPKIDSDGERLLQVSEQELKCFFSIQLTEAVERSTISKHSSQLIEYIKHRTGFLIPRGQLQNKEVYGFSHLSFQEYFCAYAISRLLPKLNPKSDIGQSILYTVNSVSWSEIWQLVFEEISLNGSSRHEIEEFFNMLFPSNLLEPLRSGSIDTAIPVEVSLYAKLISNTAIKLSTSKRKIRQSELVREYLTNDYREEYVLNELLEQLWGDEKTLIELLKNETYLCLTNRRIQDFSFLTKLQKLESICFHISEIKDLSVVSHLRNLHTLFLGHTQVKYLKPIRNHLSLEKLYLHNSLVSDLRPIKNLINIHDLTLSNTNIKSLKSIVNLSNLNRLHLHKLKINDFKPLSSLFGLENLSLEESNISDLNILSTLPKLRELNLSGTLIQDWTPLAKLNSLKKLYLRDCKFLTLDSLLQLPELEELELSKEFSMYEEELKEICSDIKFR